MVHFEVSSGKHLNPEPGRPVPELKNESLQTAAPVSLSGEERLQAIKQQLPEDHAPYTDKYFLRTKDILAAEGLNPHVRAQVFIRKGPGEVYGIDEALAAIDKYSPLTKNGGVVYAKEEGEAYRSSESILFIDAPIQDIVELETFYLGVISAATTRFNDGIQKVDTEAARDTMRQIVAAAGGRPVSYFGARHWDFREDAAIAHAAFEGGATSASTDIGAQTAGLEGTGTIPHALENIIALYHGKDRAVVESTLAFDRHIDPSVPRIALIDYNNREIDDSITTANALNGRLYAVRVDTCGENVAQGAVPALSSQEADTWRDAGLPLPSATDPDAKFWVGTGVTITGVYALRKALDAADHSSVKIFLTSGFGDINKVNAFVQAEKLLDTKLFDALGVGGIYKPCRASTMDIVMAGENEQSMIPVSKVGRSYKPNPALKPRLGKI